MIVIADTKVARRIGEYFIKHIQKLQDVSKIISEQFSNLFNFYLCD